MEQMEKYMYDGFNFYTENPQIEFDTQKWATGKEVTNLKMPLSDACVFEMSSEGVGNLIIFFARPVNSEIVGAQYGKIRLGYYVRDSVIFIVCKIDGLGDWMDAPFSIRKYKFDKVNFSKFFTPSSGLPIAINLIDRKTAVLKARRLIDAHKRFSVGLVKEINKQYKESFSAEKYIEIVSETYSTPNYN